MTILSRSEWDAFLSHHADSHILQSSLWGELKRPNGWEPVRIRRGNTGAQILFRRLPLGFSLAYIPKGPVGKDWQELWPEVDEECRKKRAISLLVEPDLWEPDPFEIERQFPVFSKVSFPIQPRRTILISLEGCEEQWLDNMKQKTRYNIRLAERKGIIVTELVDLSVFNQMMQVTGERDGFGVHVAEYYQLAYNLFAPSGECALLVAEYQGRPLAALMVFAMGKRAWYFYGASNDEERNRMPAYLLQWEAMRWAAKRGCTSYDLWGIPDEDVETLETQFSERGEGLWGVYRFKRGFGGQVNRAVGTWEKVYIPSLHWIYQKVLKRSEI
jgi:lipid II:glycine glycyltransferase (peptidoglycan interpeptide bridge formation enzyme)